MNFIQDEVNPPVESLGYHHLYFIKEDFHGHTEIALNGVETLERLIVSFVCACLLVFVFSYVRMLLEKAFVCSV